MKVFILCAVVASLVACTPATVADEIVNNESSTNIPSREEVVDSLLKLGWEMYEMHCQCADLTISDEIIDRLEANNSDIEAVIDMVEYLSGQLVFGDTIGETDAWEEWCEMIKIYEERNYTVAL